ncbi:MAG: hypothetical protein EKK64_03155 [Neisseriaceae bacterium]|nr:MAG: hypothetical protein EKK64_03155 [Neisseriaceae bacterium]
MKYLSIDIETTGLDFKKCDIIQFAAVIDDLENPKPIWSLPKLKIYFKKKYFKATAQALALHAKFNPDIFEKISKIKEHEEKEDAFCIKLKDLPIYLNNFLTKNGFEPDEKNIISITACGKNVASFDLRFLLKKIKKWGNLKFRHRSMDPAILYYEIGDKELPDMKTCFERANIKKEITHDACEDALDVIRLIRYKLLSKEKARFNPLKNFPKNLTINKEYNVYSRIKGKDEMDVILIVNDAGQETYVSEEHFTFKTNEIKIQEFEQDKELFKEENKNEKN